MKLRNSIQTAPRPNDAETVKVTLKDGNYYLGYVHERNELLGEPTVYFYVTFDPRGHSGMNVCLAESEIDNITPWDDSGQKVIWHGV